MANVRMGIDLLASSFVVLWVMKFAPPSVDCYLHLDSIHSSDQADSAVVVECSVRAHRAQLGAFRSDLAGSSSFVCKVIRISGITGVKLQGFG